MQKVSFILLLIFISFFIIFCNSSCNKEESPGEEYIIPIDSIIHPDTIIAGEKLSIAYYGILGTSDCYSFYRFDVNFDQDIINTTAIGLYTETEDCEDGIYYIDGEELSVHDLPEGDFSIIVNLPRSSTIEGKVHVRNTKK